MLLLVVAACGESAANSTTTTSVVGATTTAAATTTTTAAVSDGPLRGFSLSPRTYDGAGFTEFFETAAANGDLIERVADIVEWEEGPGSVATTVEGLAAQYGYLPVTVTGIFDVADGALLRPLDDATFDRYVAAARGYAERHRPRFLGLGVEIDTQWRTHPDDFDQFVALFAAVTEAVHTASPSTMVFPTFQLERLSGMQGGLFGGANDPAQAQWGLIDRFPDADIIGFTTYPGLVFATPDEIPDDYYSRLGGIAGGRPIVFTEMGWQAGGELGAWSGTPQLQARFVERFADLIADTSVAFYVWSFLYDQAVGEPFATMGLIGADGIPRPAWEVWGS